MRYQNLWDIAVRIMKLPDAWLDGIDKSNKSDQRKSFEIIKQWTDQNGAKEADLLRVFNEAREEGIGVPQKAIKCLQIAVPRCTVILT